MVKGCISTIKRHILGLRRLRTHVMGVKWFAILEETCEIQSRNSKT